MGISVNLEAIAGNDTTPVGAVDKTVAESANKSQLTMSCRNALDPATLKQVQAIAPKDFAKVLGNSQELSAYGHATLDGVNTAVNNILATQSKLVIPEVDTITKEMGVAVSSFRKKYENPNPDVVNAFNRWRDVVRGVFGAGQDILKSLYIDSQSTVERLDYVAGKLVYHRDQLDRNVALCDTLYVKNEESISHLIAVIAIMEEMRDLGVAKASEIQEQRNQQQRGSIEHRNLEEQLTSVNEVVAALDVRISEFQQRLFIAWATSPQIRNIRKLSFGLSQRVSLLIGITIPTMKLTIAQWGTLIQAQEGGKISDAVTAAHNDALQSFATASQEIIPQVAQAMQSPSTTPETIMKMAEAVEQNQRSLEQAFHEGMTKRAEVTSTIVTAAHMIANSNMRSNDAMLDLIKKSAQPMALESDQPVVTSEMKEYQAIAS